jgi:putative flippase GtrA
MKTEFLKTLAKIIATGIVFIWNYLARKLWIYRQKPEQPKAENGKDQ